MKSSINSGCRPLRSCLTGRRDIIVVASVSCIYGIGNPKDFAEGVVRIQSGQSISRQGFLHSLVNGLYSRTQGDFARGTFRVKGDTVDINLPYMDYGYRITFFGDEIESIETLELSTGKRIMKVDNAAIFLLIYTLPQKINYRIF